MDNIFDQDLSDNPTMESVSKLVGADLASKLSSDFGGIRLHIPSQPTPHSPISASIGIESANKIAKVYGGLRMQVPINFNKRQKILIHLQEAKLSVPKIAKEVGCTERNVYKVKAEEPRLPDTLSLFDDEG